MDALLMALGILIPSALIYFLFFKHEMKDVQETNIEDIQCPACGYYCLGDGGSYCIDKPLMVKKAKEAKDGKN